MSQVSSIEKLDIKYRALSQREKILGLVVAALFSGYIAYELLVFPIAKEIDTLSATVSTSYNQLNTLESELDQVNIRIATDPNEPLKDRIERLTARIEMLDNNFQEQINELIPAAQMPKVLESLFTKSFKLSLIEMQSVEPVDLFANDAEKRDVSLYQHGVRLVFKGQFFDVQEFLTSIEKMPYQLYWHSLNYRVEDYPQAIVEIELFTLSSNEAFIGV
jgi:MSHA biogenesis protein MshJ